MSTTYPLSEEKILFRPEDREQDEPSPVYSIPDREVPKPHNSEEWIAKVQKAQTAQELIDLAMQLPSPQPSTNKENPDFTSMAQAMTSTPD